MTPTFQPAKHSVIEAVYGAVDTSAADAISVARQTYDKSDLAKRPISDHTAVKNRYDLAAYIAPKLRILVSYMQSGTNSTAAAKAAEQLRYMSVTNAASIGDFVGNNLSYVLQYGPASDKVALKKAIAYWNENLNKLWFFNYKERESIKKLAHEYELEDVKRKARDEAEASLRSEAAAKAAADKLDAGTYYYRNGYKFEVDSAGTMVKVAPSGAQTTYRSSSSDYAKIRDAIRSDLKSGTASTTKPARRPSASASTPELPAAPSSDLPAPGLQTEASLMDAWWFWPAVGLGTVALGSGIYFGFLRTPKQQTDE